MKLALVKLPGTYANWYKRPVLGLAYVASYAMSKGFDCTVFDAYFHSWSEKELKRRLAAYKPDVVGFTAMTHEVTIAGRMAAELKVSIHAPMVVGGCHATALPGRTLAEFPGFDYAVFGEGEHTMVELLQHLQTGRPEVRDVKGVAFRQSDGSIVVNEPRPRLTPAELDALPYPAFDDYYGENREAPRPKDAYYAMFTSRGCPSNCAFCMRVLGRQVRRRSAESIVAEMEYAIERWGAHVFDFADEIFLFDTPETRRLLQMFIDRGLADRVAWSAETRANLVNPDIIALAKRAGCRCICMGVESGDDEILKGVNKGITVEQVRRAVKIIHDAHIAVGTFYILGHPNETRETVRKTVNLAVELNTHAISMGIMVPYPGTRIFEMASRGEGGYRLLTQDWSFYDKYGGHAMEIEGLPHSELLKWQRRAFIRLYLRNFRFREGLGFIWSRRHAAYYFVRRRISAILGAAEPLPAQS